MRQFWNMVQEYYKDNKAVWEEYNSTLRNQNYTYGIPKGSLFVKLKSGLNEFDREMLANRLRSYFRNDLTRLEDVKKTVQSTESTLNMLNIFTIVISIIAFILSFFLLWLSTVANIHENLWEFGVMRYFTHIYIYIYRAVGLTKKQVTRVYLYENFAIIITAITNGMVVGLLVSITLCLQINLFLELPFVFTVI